MANVPIQAFLGAQSCFRFARLDGNSNPLSAQSYLTKGLSQLRAHFGTAALNDAQLAASGVDLNSETIDSFSRILALDCMAEHLGKALGVHAQLGYREDWDKTPHKALIDGNINQTLQNMKTLGVAKLTRQIVETLGLDADQVQAIWPTQLGDVPIVAIKPARRDLT